MNGVIGTVRLLDVGPRPNVWGWGQWQHRARSRNASPSPGMLEVIERATDFLVVTLIASVSARHIVLATVTAPEAQKLTLGLTNSDFLLVVLISCIYTLCLQTVGTYSVNGSLLRVRETSCLVRAVVVGAILLELLLLLLGGEWHLFPIASTSLVMLLALLLEKHLLHLALQHICRLSAFHQRVLIYGVPDETRYLQEAIERSSPQRMQIVALVDSTRSNAEERVDDHANYLSAALIHAHHIDAVLVAHPQPADAIATPIRILAAEAGVPIYFLAGFPESGRLRLECFELDGHFLFGVRGTSVNHTQAVIKRVFDVLSSAVLLLVLALPLALAALLVRLTSPGPIFFRQVRIGEKGKPFIIFKFRTMHLSSCGDSVSPSTSQDPRITPVGRILRKCSIDELPQLWNVLQGDMAMVGPRPEMPFIVADYKEIHRLRLSVKPGLTGLWQISEHRAKPIHENIEYDLYYLRHQSMSFDVAILLHTLVFAVRGI